jgi:hypothetical protein
MIDWYSGNGRAQVVGDNKDTRGHRKRFVLLSREGVRFVGRSSDKNALSVVTRAFTGEDQQFTVLGGG